MSSHFGAFKYGGGTINQSTVIEGPTTNFFSYVESETGTEYNGAENVLTSAEGGDYQVMISLPMNNSGGAGLTNLRVSILQYYVSDSTWYEMSSARDSVERAAGEAFSLAVTAQLRLAEGDKLTYRIDNLSPDTTIDFENGGSFSAHKLP